MSATPTLFKTFVGRVLATRNAAHIAHWNSTSHARHVALDEFYSGILDQLDAIVESYQGKFGLVGDVPHHPPPNGDILSHMVVEREWIADNKQAISGGNDALANLVDEMCAIYMKQAYKLRHLS